MQAIATDPAPIPIPFQTLTFEEAETLFVGTSACSPLIAALIARINAVLGIRVGNIHAAIYGLGDGSPAIRSVTRGCNVPAAQYYPAKGYRASLGWDACTGLGLPQGKALMAALAEYYRLHPPPGSNVLR